MIYWGESKRGPNKFGLERVTVPGSNLFVLDDYSKKGLKSHPEPSIGAQQKIILRELITYDIIVLLNQLKSRLGLRSIT